MKKSIFSLLMAVALILGSSVMAQTAPAKTALKAKTECKTDAKKAPAKAKKATAKKAEASEKTATKTPAAK